MSLVFLIPLWTRADVGEMMPSGGGKQYGEVRRRIALKETVSCIRVLLIEDNPGDVRLVELMLADAGMAPSSAQKFEMTHAGTLAAGLEQLRLGEFDVVLLDLSLPDSHGIDTFNAVCCHASDVPCLLMTGLDDADLAVRVMQAGAQDYLTKGNFDGALLGRAIRYAIERHRLRSRLENTLAALQASEARFRTIIEQNVDGVIIVDDLGTICFANPAAEKLFGRNLEDLDGASFGLPVNKNVLSEIEIVRPEEGIVTVELRWVEIEWEGRPAHLVSLRDISNRKRLESQLIQSRKMETVGRLAGGVAHEFNNLLTSMIGYGSLARDALEAGDPVRTDIEAVLHSADRAAEITQQLLTFSRHQGNLAVTDDVDLNRLLSGIEQMLRRLVGRRVEVTLQLDSDLGVVRADPNQIEQALLNLVTNALDAMPQGGKLTIETANVVLDREIEQDLPDGASGDYVMLAVSDTGVGMTTEVKSHLFEPFFTTKDVGQGTGLGLSIVYGIVRRFGGHVRAYSEPGRGTIFKIYFPRLGGKAASTAQPRAEVSHGDETILLVDDEPVFREFAGRALCQHGYTVLEAGDAREALDMVLGYDGCIDLIVTDIVMPGMDGMELAREVRKLCPGMKFLFVSGYTEDTAKCGGLLASGEEFLEKPFIMSMLCHKVRNILKG